MPIPSSRLNELRTETRDRLAALTAEIDNLDRRVAQLRRDALATHGAVQVLDLLVAEDAAVVPPADVVPLPAPNAS